MQGFDSSESGHIQEDLDFKEGVRQWRNESRTSQDFLNIGCAGLLRLPLSK